MVELNPTTRKFRVRTVLTRKRINRSDTSEFAFRNAMNASAGTMATTLSSSVYSVAERASPSIAESSPKYWPA